MKTAIEGTFGEQTCDVYILASFKSLAREPAELYCPCCLLSWFLWSGESRKEKTLRKAREIQEIFPDQLEEFASRLTSVNRIFVFDPS